MIYKTEKDFQKDYVQKLKADGWRTYKIPDVNMQIKPFDIIAVSMQRWKLMVKAIELKHCNLKKGVTYEQAYKMLRPNQVWALADIQKHWATSLVIVYNQAEDKVYELEFKLLDIEGGEL